LLDRSIILNLIPIPDSGRIQKRILERDFLQARSQLLGALYSAVSDGLRNLPAVTQDLPRMADFAAWVVAAEAALGIPPGGFLERYVGNRDTVHIVALEGSPIGLPVLEFARDRGVDGWSGTATELLSEIERRVSESIRRRQEWPGTPQKIGNSLRRIAPNLRGAGVNVDFQPSGQRFIHISLMEHSAVQAVHDDSPSAGSQDAPGGCDVDGSQCPSRPEPCNPPPAPSTNSAGLDFLDGTDACSHNPSEDADDWTEEIL
jgi:hypothetical protein